MAFTLSSSRSAAHQPPPQLLRIPAVFPGSHSLCPTRRGSAPGTHESRSRVDFPGGEEGGPHPHNHHTPAPLSRGQRSNRGGGAVAHAGSSFMIRDLLGSNLNPEAAARSDDVTAAKPNQEPEAATTQQMNAGGGVGVGGDDRIPLPENRFRSRLGSDFRSRVHRETIQSGSPPETMNPGRETCSSSSSSSNRLSTSFSPQGPRHTSLEQGPFPHLASPSSAFTLLNPGHPPVAVPLAAPHPCSQPATLPQPMPPLARLPFSYEEQGITPNPFVQSLHQIHNFHTQMGAMTTGVFSPLGAYTRHPNELPYFGRYLTNSKYMQLLLVLNIKISFISQYLSTAFIDIAVTTQQKYH